MNVMFIHILYNKYFVHLGFSHSDQITVWKVMKVVNGESFRYPYQYESRVTCLSLSIKENQINEKGGDLQVGN